MAKKKKQAAELGIDINANTAQLATDMGRAVGILDGFEKRIKKFNGAMKAMVPVAAVVAAGAAVKKLHGEVAELAALGGDVGSIKESFIALGGSVAQIEAARKSVLGMADSFELMEAANKGLLRNIKGYNENFGTLTDLSARLGDALRRGPVDVLNELTGALGKGSTKELNALGFAIEKSGDKAKIAAQFWQQVPGVMERLGPISDSAANALSSINKTLEEGRKTTAITINENEDLIRGYRDLDKTLTELDWEEFGRGLVSIETILVRLSNSVLPTAVRWMNEFARGLDFLIGDSTQAKLDRLADEIATMEKELNNPRFSNGYGIVGAIFGDDISASIAKKKAEFSELMKAQNAEQAKADAARDERAKKGAELRKKYEEEAAEAAAAALREQAAGAIEGLREKYAESSRDGTLAGIKESIENLTKAGSTRGLPELLDKFEAITKEGILAGMDEAVRTGGPEAQKLAEQIATAQSKETRRVYEKEIAKDVEDALTEAHENAVQAYADAFSEVTNEISSIFDALGVDASGIFKTMDSLLSDEVKAKMMEGIGSALGMTGKELGAYFGALNTGIGAITSARDIDRTTRSNQGTGGAVGTGVGATAGGIIGSAWGPMGTAVGTAIGAEVGKVAGSIIGGMIGRGSQNPDTIGRHTVANFLEEEFKKLHQISFFNPDKKLTNFAGDKLNFVEGSKSRFNDGTWGEEFKKMGDQAFATFGGLGDALKHLQGIAEDVGPQIGFILAQNLGGNIDNARLLVYQLGLSFEDMSGALVEMGRSGEKTWGEVTRGIQGLTEAFKPGLVAFGDIKGAIDEIIQSGGRGMAALKGLKDAATETLEKGGKTLQDMKNLALSQGADPAVVEAMMKSIEAMGLKTLESILGAEDQVLGGVIAGMGAGNEALQKQWDVMGDKLKGMAETLQSMDEHLNKELVIDVKTKMDDQTQDAIDAGVFNGTQLETVTRQLKGFSVPTLPASRSLPTSAPSISNSARANMAPVSFHLDLRNAAPGVSAEVKTALATLESRVMRKTLDAVYDARERGAL